MSQIMRGDLIQRYHGIWRLCEIYVRLQPSAKRYESDARRVLERVIFPALYADPGVKAILFVGVAPCTSWYPTVFRTRPGLDVLDNRLGSGCRALGRQRAHRVARFESLASDEGSQGAPDVVHSFSCFSKADRGLTRTVL